MGRTRKCIVTNDIIAEVSKIERQIRAVEVLLGRVEKNAYHEEISKDFSKKYGKLRMITGPRKPGSSSVSVNFRYQRETNKNSKKIRSESRRLWKKAERMQRNDLKRAFDLMFKNIWGWWD